MKSSDLITGLLCHHLAESNQSHFSYFGDAIDAVTASGILHDTILVFTARHHAANAGMAEHFHCDVNVFTDDVAELKFNWSANIPTASLLYPFITHTFLNDVVPYLETDLVFYLEDAWRLVDPALASTLSNEIAEAGVTRQRVGMSVANNNDMQANISPLTMNTDRAEY